MTSRKQNADIESVIADIMQSKKYRDIDICEDTVRDLIVTELKHHKKKKDAIKAARKKLHRIVATYLGDPDYTVAAKELEVAFQSSNPDVIRETCAHIMAAHISTKERLSILDKFYSRIFEVTGAPSTLLDVACGLNPLSLPWMGLSTSTRYYAYDIHQQRVDFLNHYFLLQGLLPLARVQDILVHFPEEEGDIAFLLKEVHTFEQRQRGCSFPLLDALRVRYLVVSFPTRSLSGRWDLTDRHRQLFYNIIEGRSWQITEIEFENELVFCVDKSQATDLSDE
jgi:16S rRNA (guanine(1405)-N(7))-methyltransferase